MSKRYVMIEMPWQSRMAVPVDVAAKIFEEVYAVTDNGRGLELNESQSISMHLVEADTMTAAIVASKLGK